MSAYLFDVPSGYITNGVPYPMGQPSVAYPLKEDQNYARVWNQPFIVTGVSVPATGLSTDWFSGSYVVGESDREPLGSDLYAFTRTYAEVPASHNTFESLAYVFPGLFSFASGYRATFSKPVVSRVAHDYYYADNPATITLSGAQTYLWNGFDTQTLNTYTVPTVATYSGWIGTAQEIVAEDSRLVRYAGSIWDRQTRFIKAQ